MPSGEQTRGMRSMSAHVACRVSLGVQQGVGFARRELSERWKFIRQFAMEKHLTAWRELPDTPWLKDSPRSAQNKAIEDLDRALKNFFEQHAVFPRFQRKGQSGDHFRSPEKKAITLDAATAFIKLPKLGWTRYRNSESCSAICATSPYRTRVASDMRET